MVDIIIWLVMEIIFGFLCYFTGVVILRLLTLGKVKFPMLSFYAYRDAKAAKVKYVNRVHFLGLMFWISALLLAIALNWH